LPDRRRQLLRIHRPGAQKKRRKDKWLFTKKGERFFALLGLWRTHKDVGEAFTMLTMEPSQDTAPYHDRQIAILDRADWAIWLDPSISSKTILKPLPAGNEPALAAQDA
jgi:putative SOS response-associated peptidase YedK